jgi:hypothetical protein
VKGEPGTWAIRGGNAASASLSTFWSGARPSDGYNPMDKEGTHVMWKSCAETSNTQDEVLVTDVSDTISGPPFLDDPASAEDLPPKDAGGLVKNNLNAKLTTDSPSVVTRIRRV